MRKHIKILISLLCLLLLLSGCNESSIVFDHNKWIDAKDSETLGERKKMAQYLIENQTLIGKSKTEVIQLLGESEDYSNIRENELYYTINLDYGMDIDPVEVEYLIVTINSDNRVISTTRKIISIR